MGLIMGPIKSYRRIVNNVIIGVKTERLAII
jgi:hypothetical protein